MIRFIAGGKGEGKTKLLIEMTNARAKTSDGSIVFVDDDKRHIYCLHHTIRFVETGKNKLTNYGELVGYIMGVISMNNDITDIFIDGLTNIVQTVSETEMIEQTERLMKISERYEIDFVISINCNKDSLPDKIKPLLM
ncbi:MAG: hypothetical protein FWE82_05905 [Defluviitaleaceae bacterium]|nr:hypothetical protein [Defluviitaleaceae bacterium]